MRLSDTIEQFIKALLAEGGPEVEVRRSELARYFNCAPSQINYVLATRFSLDDGYVTESRRGGGGYIRIVRVAEEGGRLAWLIRERIGVAIGEGEALRLVAQLAAQQTISPGEAAIMQAAVSSQATPVPLPEEMKDVLRAATLRAMLTALARQGRDAE